MYVRFAFLADHVIRDAQGKHSYINVFDVIFAKKLPTRYRRLTLAMSIAGNATEEGKHDLKVELVDDDFNKIFTPPMLKLELSSKNRPIPTAPLSTVVSIEFENLDFKKPGNYEFLINVDGRHLGSVPVYVRKAVTPKKK